MGEEQRTRLTKQEGHLYLIRFTRQWVPSGPRARRYVPINAVTPTAEALLLDKAES